MYHVVYFGCGQSDGHGPVPTASVPMRRRRATCCRLRYSGQRSALAERGATMTTTAALREEQIEVAGCPITVRVTGQGAPLILLPRENIDPVDLPFTAR